MSSDAIPLSQGDIAATNVLPAFETSLRFGATEAELEAALGWRRADLTRPDARVSGASTYRHLELMFAKPGYAQFVTAAARAHDVASLGVVGLACRTMPDVSAALACHGRFQRLTNRTATYEAALTADGLHLREHRDDDREGSLLLSDFTMLVARHLLEQLTNAAVPVRAVYSRRRHVSDSERAVYERELGAPLHTGARHAALVLAPTFARAPVPKADAALEAYFRDVLERALPPRSDEPPMLATVRATLRERVRDGHPTLVDVARALGLSARTLQRRLAAHDTTFQQVLDETLNVLAQGYLKQPQLSLAEVAWLLGYQEEASFFRAFRRWHGMPPGEYRRRR